MYGECRTLSRRPHDRRTRPPKDRSLFDRGTLRQIRIAGQIAADRFIQTSTFINFYSMDVVYISEDIIVIMNLYLCI